MVEMSCSVGLNCPSMSYVLVLSTVKAMVSPGERGGGAMVGGGGDAASPSTQTLPDTALTKFGVIGT